MGRQFTTRSSGQNCNEDRNWQNFNNPASDSNSARQQSSDYQTARTANRYKVSHFIEVAVNGDLKAF